MNVNTGTNEARIEELKRKRDVMNTISPTFCAAKWLQTTLYLQNGFNHSCHHPSPHKIPLSEIENDVSSLHNSEHKKKQRQLMLEGQRPRECEYCWKIEDLGKDYFSDRHYKTAEHWSFDKVEELSSHPWDQNVYPTYLEVSFSNACNFACAYCSPEISSKWMEDIKQNGPYPTTFSAHHLDWLKEAGRFPYKNSEHNPYSEAFKIWFPEALKHLRVFRMTGGEPTMSKDFWQTMEMIKKNPQPNLELAVNTNLGSSPELIDRLIADINDLEYSVKQIDIYTSIESYGKQAEYARDGLNYRDWHNNVQKILNMTKSRVTIMTTINILSLPTFTKFIEELMELRIFFNKFTEENMIPLSVNYLRYPVHLQATMLDKATRDMYADQIEEYCRGWLKYHSPSHHARLYLEEFDQIQRFCDYLRTEPTQDKYRADFVKFVNEYDKRRGKNFAETFPEYTHLIEEWK